jgi:hypothetical protein
LEEDDFGKKKRKLECFDQESNQQKKSCLEAECENSSDRPVSVWDLPTSGNPHHDRPESKMNADGYASSVSETSHHSVDLNRGSSSSSDDSSPNDWCAVSDKKKKKKAKSPTMTSNGTVTFDSCSKEKDACTATPSRSSPRGNKTASETIKDTTFIDRKSKQKSKSYHSPNAQTVPPTFCEYPVIVQDLKTSASATLKALMWKLSDILSKSVGPGIRQIKPLGNNKFLIGCDSFRQQSRLVALTQLGGIDVKGSIPVPTVQGVIYGIDHSVSEGEVIDRFEVALDAEGCPTDARVRDIVRLNLPDGSPSRAMRITFEATSLPSVAKINCTEFAVQPYSARIPRCFQCQKLGHLKKNCPSQTVICATCGSRGHAAAACTSNKRYCINCKGDHSAAYGGCIAMKSWSLANKIRSQNYMPRALAFQQAKQIVAEKMATKATKPGVGLKPNDSWKAEAVSASVPSYASVTAAGRSGHYSQSHCPVPNPLSSNQKVCTQSVTHEILPKVADRGETSQTPSLPQKNQSSHGSLVKENSELKAKVISLENKLDALTKTLAEVQNELTSMRLKQTSVSQSHALETNPFAQSSSATSFQNLPLASFLSTMIEEIVHKCLQNSAMSSFTISKPHNG